MSARPYIKRGTIQPKRGKRTRRAMIRLRHVFAREKFIRWATARGMFAGLSVGTAPHRKVPQLWHEWHRRGAV
jgi:hypothetical protein